MANVYNRGKYNLGTGTVDWTTTAITVALVTSSYTYNADHDDLADITNELSGGGYARVALGTPTVTENDTNDRVEYDAVDTTFSSLGALAGTPARTVLAENVGAGDADKELLCSNVLTTPPAPNGGDYTIQWGSTGIINLNDS